MYDLSKLIEVTLNNENDFLKVRETLSRIGIASKKDKILYQSCHILHKQKRYYIVHFKQLFQLDGKQTDFSVDDQSRLNTIANLLSEWKLVKLIDPKKSAAPVAPLSQIKILSFSEKNDWELVTKYNIGKKKAELNG